jgi:hypothetical protein
MARSMPRPSAPAFVALLAALFSLALAAPASAESALEQYQRTGRIDPCNREGIAGVPNDVEQYAPDFLEALRDAQRRGCDAGASPTEPTQTDDTGAPVVAGAQIPPGSRYVPKPPAPPRPPYRGGEATTPLPLATSTDMRTPAPILALAIMAALALAGTGALAVWRLMGWGGEWASPLRHGFGELGLRMGAAGAATADWARDLLGRRRA